MPAALRRYGLLSLVVLAGALTALAVPSAPAATKSPSAQRARLSVGVAVLRFSTRGRTLKATGYVTATLTEQNGRRRTIRTRVGFTAARTETARSCTCTSISSTCSCSA